jgi:hypothetical protein
MIIFSFCFGSNLDAWCAPGYMKVRITGANDIIAGKEM